MSCIFVRKNREKSFVSLYDECVLLLEMMIIPTLNIRLFAETFVLCMSCEACLWEVGYECMCVFVFVCVREFVSFLCADAS